MTDEETLRDLLETATTDLYAPKVPLRSRPAVVELGTGRPLPSRSRTRLAVVARVAAAAGAAAAVITVVALGVPSSFGGHRGGDRRASAVGPQGPTVLYRLASTVRKLPAPAGRYAVQIEQQSEGSTSYLKATIIDSRTGDTWTYQKGGGVPAALPMAPGFSPTEDQLLAADPADPARLRSALIAQASTSSTGPAAQQTPDDLAVSRAIDTLWNPLVQPVLRAALVSVIASSPGVVIDPRATDSRGRKSIEISYHDRGLGVRLSVYLSPATGVVLENSELAYAASAEPGLAGHDLYLTQYWTNTSPTSNPLDG